MPDTHEDPLTLRLQRIENDHSAFRTRLHDVANQLQTIVLGVADIQHGMKDQDKALDGLSRGHEKLDHAINGNGKPGLKADLATINSDLKQDINKLTDRHLGTQRTVDGLVKACWILFGLVASGFVATMFKLLAGAH